MSHNATPNTSRVELRKTLTLVPVVMMGLAYMQPMTLFDTFGIVSGMTDGHVPTAYAFALIAILFTALSYGKLVRRYPSAGSAYTYAQKSISPTVGFMVGWSSLLDYLFAPMINILLAKIYFEALVPSIPSWIFVVALVAFMTAFNLRSLKSVANFNTVIVLLQVVLIAVILGMVVYGVFEGEGAGTLASSRPFWSGDAHVIPMITGATILCFSFTGFDGISNLSEETKDAERVIPRAIFLTALIGGLIFIVSTYLLQLYFPDISRFKDPDASQPEIMLYVAGKFFQVDPQRADGQSAAHRQEQILEVVFQRLVTLLTDPELGDHRQVNEGKRHQRTKVNQRRRHHQVEVDCQQSNRPNQNDVHGRSTPFRVYITEEAFREYAVTTHHVHQTRNACMRRHT